MLELNVRIVSPGCDLEVPVRYVEARGAVVTHDLLQKACTTMRYRHRLAAVPDESGHGLLVAAVDPVRTMHLTGRDWALDLRDTGECQQLSVADPEWRQRIALLIERAVCAELVRRTNLWTLGSPRIWYEPQPFIQRDGIAAYRRYAVAALFIEGEGIGVAIDVSTAFFTNRTLAYFFDQAVTPHEQRDRQRQFEELTARQKGQKGTLWYDNGSAQMNCYFASAPAGLTCATTGPVPVRGKRYPSVEAFYAAERRQLRIRANARAVNVSFRDSGRPVPVAAELLRVRVMNDDVPSALENVDKIPPAARRGQIQAFWKRIEPSPLGRVAPGLRPGFWAPDHRRVFQCDQPALEFGSDARLAPPRIKTVQAYKAHYRQREEYLEANGCSLIPPAMTRNVYLAFPHAFPRPAIDALQRDIADAISTWTKCSVRVEPVPFADIADAVAQLRRFAPSGDALFVLPPGPAAYYEAAYRLSEWRIKRITQRTLVRHHDLLVNGAGDRRTGQLSRSLGRSRWRTFVTLNGLDVLQQLDVIPYRFDRAGVYEAHLSIDVGYDRRYFALSLLLARVTAGVAEFRMRTNVVDKVDHQHESINPVILADNLELLVNQVLRRHGPPLESLLVLRDGRLLERHGVEMGLERLKSHGRLATNARVDFAEIHKQTMEGLRMWETDAEGNVFNPLEGAAVLIDSRTALVATTGASTLTQGTAHPLLIVASEACGSIVEVVNATFAEAQLNWSSPRVAQRLPTSLKRTDDDLKTRSAQEVRRLS